MIMDVILFFLFIFALGLCARYTVGIIGDVYNARLKELLEQQCPPHKWIRVNGIVKISPEDTERYKVAQLVCEKCACLPGRYNTDKEDY